MTDRALVYPLCNYVAEKLRPTGIHPNTITLCNVPVVLVNGYGMINGSYWFVLFNTILSNFIDCLDGEYARITNQVTKFGAQLDIAVDNLSIATYLFGFFGSIIPQIATIWFYGFCMSYAYFMTKWGVDYTTHKPHNEMVTFIYNNSVLFRVWAVFIWYFFMKANQV